jgi:hypothetical protein
MKLHNEELQNLSLSLNIVRQIKSMGMRWPGHVEHMGEERKINVKGFGGKARRKETARKTEA